MSDDQQRAFVLKASMKQLSSAMAPPKRKPVDPAKEALQERVFASEKGFRDSSEVSVFCCHSHDFSAHHPAPFAAC